MNAGFGLWQPGFGSQAVPDRANSAAARAAMMNYRGDGGRIPGRKPTTRLVPPALEDAALQRLGPENGSGGASTPREDTAEPVLSPFVAR